jgi:hypothetical protein
MNTTELITEIKNCFKIADKWHFITHIVNGKPVQLKFFVGKKETDIQIFKIGHLHQSIGFNYSGKKKTMDKIIEILNNSL